MVYLRKLDADCEGIVGLQPEGQYFVPREVAGRAQPTIDVAAPSPPANPGVPAQQSLSPAPFRLGACPSTPEAPQQRDSASSGSPGSLPLSYCKLLLEQRGLFPFPRSPFPARLGWILGRERAVPVGEAPLSGIVAAMSWYDQQGKT